jgi:choice-of-anchor B domain-containing protein
MKKLISVFLFPLFIYPQGWNTELIGSLEYSQGLNDIWGYKAGNGNEYALVGTETGTSIVRIDDGFFGFVEVGFIPGDNSVWRDVKTHGHYMYIGTEASQGIQVVNIEDPENAELVYTWEGVTNSHNIFQADGYLYVVGASGYHIHILDLSNPAHPVEVGGWTGEYIHDLYVQGDYAYAAGIYSSTMYIIDISDKTNPVTVTSWTYPGSAHACWVTEDGNYLISADETAGGNIKIWDIQDFSNINMISQWTVEGGGDKSVHNVFVRDQYLYASYYVFGLQVLDISDPYNPTHAGYYDTYPGNDGLYNGAWGAYPFTESCYTYISDIEHGLYVVDFIGCNSATAALTYSPNFFGFSVESGQSASSTLSVTNSGETGSVLFYDVSIATPSPFEHSGGGPDGFGHFWSDSDLEPSINYGWIEISNDPNTQQVTFPSNDGGSGFINIGFDFLFYEESYAQCIVNPNGWVGFGEDNTEWSNTQIPSTNSPRPAVFGFWDDLNPVNNNCNDYCSGNVYVNSNPDRFVAWFDQVAGWWSNNPESYYDFQIVLYPGGNIHLNYREITGTHSATIGIQDGSGTVGLQVAHNSNYVHNNLSVRIIESESSGWLDVSSENNEMNGLLSAGETAEFTVTADASGLELGVYDAWIILDTNVEQDIETPVVLSVIEGSPEMTLEITHMEGWNMVGLPLSVEDASYGTLFADAVDETLYGFDGSYYGSDVLETGNGYWLVFNTAGSSEIIGEEFSSLTISLSEGWNLIAGISFQVAVEDISDPDGIIVPGTIYGYGDGYFNADVIEPGKGYWVNASADGDVTFGEEALAKSRFVFEDMTVGANTLTINGQDLYFGNDIPADKMVSYSLPPKPPSGAFDVRFSGDWKYCNNNCEIEVLNTSGTLNFIYDLSEQVEQIWILTSMRGKSYELEDSGEITIPSEKKYFLTKKATVPISFSLHQNYPNPFNPVTNIRYDLQSNQYVTLIIYDLNGREINRLVNKNQSVGYKSTQWNATDMQGKPVSAGVYLYQIQAGAFIETRKMVLLK